MQDKPAKFIPVKIGDVPREVIPITPSLHLLHQARKARQGGHCAHGFLGVLYDLRLNASDDWYKQ